jgi:hypothetical protein
VSDSLTGGSEGPIKRTSFPSTYAEGAHKTPQIMSHGGIGTRDNVFDSTTLHYDQAVEARDITLEVKVFNPVPIFVGTYSHVFRGLYNGETVRN